MSRLGLFVCRAGAYLVDCAVIAVYAVVLAVVTMTLAPDAQLSRPAAYLLALATLTGPVVLAFAVMEARLGLSPGKAALGLRVDRDGACPGFPRALARNLIKFLPWEIAHIGIWLTPGQPLVDPPGALSLGLMNAAMAAVLAQAVLIGVFRAGAHDWIAGARVVRR
jgi:hypothetical protein